MTGQLQWLSIGNYVDDYRGYLSQYDFNATAGIKRGKGF